MLRQFLAKRQFSAAASQDQQFMRMSSIYQSYFSHENQRKIVCIGRNYHAHIAELNNSLPTEPMWFDKPLSALLTPGKSLKLEESHVDVHHEVELGVVIGMRGRNIRPENVHRHIAGYFIGVDFCNRVLQRRNNGDGSDWCMAKGSNQFAAVSEYIHKSAIPDSSNVDIEL